MIEITHPTPFGEARIHVLDSRDELPGLYHNLSGFSHTALDTETTGLDWYNPDFRVRTIQVGSGLESWVIPVEELGFTKDDLHRLVNGRRLIIQNAAYDALAIRAHFEYDLDWGLITDTKILAHLADPRARKEGGMGHSLQELTERLVSPQLAEEVKGSMKEMAKAAGCKVGEVFSKINVWNRTYLLYAGMDTILTHRVWERLKDRLGELERECGFDPVLIGIEHNLARVCAEIEWNGFKVDVAYCERLIASLEEERAVWEAMALLEYDLESVNSPDELAATIQELGYELTEKTPSGKPKVDKAVLTKLSEQGCTLADYVLAAKSAGKKAKAWVSKFLEDRDAHDRVHASIHPLAARTGRMSVSGIPAQQLPSSDWEIRRCFIPEEGNSIIACDYQAQELRVLSALSGDKNMQQAFREGADLHQLTANASGVDRKVGKTVNFAYVYGSGAYNIAKTCDISVAKAKQVIKGFEDTYPGVKRYSEKLQQQVKKDGYVRTPSGRILPVDKDRGYSVLNYCFTPDTPILTADLRHVRADSVKVGDELVGFDEHRPGGPRGKGHRSFRTAVVEKVSEVWKPGVVVRSSDGRETVCSEDHQWFVRIPDRQPRYRWVQAKDLTPDMQLLSVGVWEEEQSRLGGYLAGLYDGEGCLQARAGGSKTTGLVFSQKPGVVMDSFTAGMDELGLAYSYYKRAPNSTSPTDTVSIQGVTNILRTLGVLRPVRFIQRSKDVFDGAKIVGGRQFDTPHIESVTFVGHLKMSSIQTSTRTLIANGYLSHNCIQSTSRDITASAILRLDDEGFTKHARLPIHDEIVAEVPAEYAEDAAVRFAQIMRVKFMGVWIDSDHEVYGKSWGGGYVGEDKQDQEAYAATFKHA